MAATITSPYAPDFRLSPGTEVDYGCFWTSEGVPGYRVTYVERERKVVAVKSDQEWIVLARDIDFAVVEILLSKPYYTVGLAVQAYAEAKGEIGWAIACNKGEDISWVARRLRPWQWGSQIVTYKPKAGTDRREAEDNARAKAVRHHASVHNIASVGGGWYRIHGGEGRSYAQGHAAYVSASRSTLLDLGVSSDGTYRWAVAGK